MSKREDTYMMLEKAQAYASSFSTCSKVQVGSLIVTVNLDTVYGCNKGIERNCMIEGCHRVEKYGENSKLHRLPSDCVAIHSEVDAISRAARRGLCLNGAVIFITRYPCEACARAIALSGIRKVCYGRTEEISEMTRQIFEASGIEVVHEKDWVYEDNNS